MRAYIPRIGLLAFAIAIMLGSALAQPSNLTTGQDTPPSPTVDVSTPAATESESDKSNTSESKTRPTEFEYKVILAAIIIIFLGVVIIRVIEWLRTLSQNDFNLQLKHLEKGESFTVSQNSSIFVQDPAAQQVTGMGLAATKQIEVVITGPKTIHVGEIATYVLTTDDTTPHTFVWAFEDKATGLVQYEGANAQLIATAVGKIKLIATVDDSDAKATFEIDVIAAEEAKVATLSNSTAGWGTMLLSVLILGFGLILGLITNEAAAVLTLFGTMAGYAFGRKSKEEV